ncbi:MAG: cell division protein FtsQ/DivIB [Francisellaceae bacterium]
MPKRIIIKSIFAAVFVGVVFWLLVQVAKYESRPLSNIEIISNESLIYTDQKALVNLLKPYRKLSWFSLDVENIAATLLSSYPGIERVKVEKKWPSTLKISIDQYKPIAWWQDKRQILLNNFSIIMPAQFVYAKVLPLYQGAKNQEKEIDGMYHKLEPLAEKKGLDITEIARVADGWQLILSDGIMLYLPDEGVVMRLKKLLQALSLISVAKGEKIGYIDARYHSGFAVKMVRNT